MVLAVPQLLAVVVVVVVVVVPAPPTPHPAMYSSGTSHLCTTRPSCQPRRVASGWLHYSVVGVGVGLVRVVWVWVGGWVWVWGVAVRVGLVVRVLVSEPVLEVLVVWEDWRRNRAVWVVWVVWVVLAALAGVCHRSTAVAPSHPPPLVAQPALVVWGSGWVWQAVVGGPLVVLTHHHTAWLVVWVWVAVCRQ